VGIRRSYGAGLFLSSVHDGFEELNPIAVDDEADDTVELVANDDPAGGIGRIDDREVIEELVGFGNLYELAILENDSERKYGSRLVHGKPPGRFGAGIPL
jgi:hypothetical protein